MRSYLMWAAIVSALALGGSAQAAVTEADWAEMPAPEKLSEAYPKLAYALAVEGLAIVECRVTAGGLLESCKVAEETPKAFGFGAAGLSLTPYFRMRPKLRDGRPTEGDVRIPIQFLLPAPDSIGVTASPSSPQELDLARKLVRLTGHAAIFREYFSSKAQLIEVSRTPGAPPEARRTAAAAIRSAAESRLDDMLDELAHAFAAAFEEPQLTAFVRAAGQSPSPPFLVMRQEQVKRDAALSQEFGRRLMIAARAAFCERQACTPDPEFGLPRAGAQTPEVTISAPIWIERPTYEQIGRARPPLAAMFALEGRVLLACHVGALGIAEQCEVAEETPPGLGFGAAAQSLGSYFRLSPAMMQRPSGDIAAAQLRFPRPFPRPTLLPDAPEPSAAKLALAREFVALSSGETEFEEQLRRAEQSFMAVRLEGVDPGTRETAREALAAGSERAWRETQDLAARGYADLFSEEELKHGVVFLKSPAGRALIAKRPVLGDALTATLRAYDSVVAADAGRMFCLVRGCGPKAEWLRPPPAGERDL